MDATESRSGGSPGAASGRIAVRAQTEKKTGPIYLDVMVTDKAGAPVSGLELKDFTLLDNNQPGKILSFQAFGEARKRPVRRLK